MNARERVYYESYMRSTKRTIFDVYKNPSKAKRDAWTYHWSISPSNAECFAILSHNRQFFTMAYLAIINNIPAMVVITPCHKFSIRLTVGEYRAACEYNNKHVI